MSVRALARELGISPTAVSLALKNSPRISAELRDRVQALAKKLGYTPNARLSEVMDEVRRSAAPAYRATLAAISLYPAEEPWAKPPYLYLRDVLDSATERANAHGYRMEYIWLKKPGQSPLGCRSLLEARGIQGIFCLGSPDPEEELPKEFKGFAVVTFSASIPTKLHRVVSHFSADASTLFDRLLRRGYQRPGLAILVHGDRRTEHAYSATYLGVWERLLHSHPIPVLRADTWNAADFDAWFTTQRPDVIVMHQSPAYIAGVEAYLAQRKLRVPRDIGLALLDLNPDRERYSGICQDPKRMSATAVEILIGRILLRDFEPPKFPKFELVAGEWNPGQTLRPE